jgi:hypothetical protein
MLIITLSKTIYWTTLLFIMYFKNSFPVNHLPLILSIRRITKRDSACVKQDVMGWACDRQRHTHSEQQSLWAMLHTRNKMIKTSPSTICIENLRYPVHWQNPKVCVSFLPCNSWQIFKRSRKKSLLTTCLKRFTPLQTLQSLVEHRYTILQRLSSCIQFVEIYV